MPNAPANQVLKLFPARDSTPGARDRILAIIDGEAQSIPAGNVVGESGITTGTTAISGGTDTRVLFNDGGTVGEDAGLTFNKTTDALTVGGVGNFGAGQINLTAGNWLYHSAGTLNLGIAFSDRFSVSSARAQIVSDMSYDWSSGALNASSDVRLFRDDANTLAQRNGTNAQAFRFYGTYTDASNYERLALGVSASDFIIIPQAAGTGTLRSLVFGTNASRRWLVNPSGHFLADTDNTYDIGASGATSPRSIYFGTSIFRGSTKILGAQGAAVADATDAASTQARLNDLLARLRTHGLIAT